MCLLGLLLDWKEIFDLEITVIHVNHGIRGEAADEDERFVGEFCRSHNTKFMTVRADIPAMAEASGCTEEEEGRNFRYRTFLETARRLGYNRIAVAHNRSDNAETVIFNMLRGSGISGLRGISPVRVIDTRESAALGGCINGETREPGASCGMPEQEPLTIIRPLLDTSRADIETYLAENGISYRTDATNFDTKYSRNAIRNIILPIFREQINAQAEEHIVRLAETAAGFEALADRLVKEKLEGLRERGRLIYSDTPGYSEVRIDAQELIGEDALLRNMIVRSLAGGLAGRLKDITNTHIGSAAELLFKEVGKRVSLPYEITAFRDYDELVLRRRLGGSSAGIPEQTGENSTVSIGDPAVYTKDDPYTFRMPDGELRLYVTEADKDFDFAKKICTKCFDYDKIVNRISLRTRRSGDYLLVKRRSPDPDKTVCRKSLKSWMIDNKIPAGLRDSIMLVTEGSHVLWIIGYRRDDSCFIDEDTRRMLVIELKEV